MKKFLVVLLACMVVFAFSANAFAADEAIPDFSDIADLSQVAQNSIQRLAVLGVLEGDTGLGGAYRPADTITRAEFAKIVCYLADRADGVEALNGYVTPYSDVPAGQWFTGWIYRATESGFFQGDPSGIFRPYDKITMQEVSTVLLRVAGYTDALKGVWPASYNNKAYNVGLTDDVAYVPTAYATRADVAVMANTALDLNLVVYVENEIAQAIGQVGLINGQNVLGGATVDSDGFAEVYYMTNENGSQVRRLATILWKSFGGEVQSNAFFNVDADGMDEGIAWEYADYDDGEIALISPDFVEAYELRYDELASKYYITRGFDVTELAYMYASVTYVDEEIVFVDVKSDCYTSSKIKITEDFTANDWNEDAPELLVGGKTLKASKLDMFKEYIGYLSLTDNEKNTEFYGKVYVDKDGNWYGIKDYSIYNDYEYGVVEEVDDDYITFESVADTYATLDDIDVDDEFIIYKDGKFVAIEDLEAGDVLYEVNVEVGTEDGFYLAFAPVTAEMTKLAIPTASTTGNIQYAKLTIDGTVYKTYADFADDANYAVYSDDEGKNYAAFNRANVSKDAFGEIKFVKAYDFMQVASVVASVEKASDFWGVVDEYYWKGVLVDPNYAYGTTTKIESVSIFTTTGEYVEYEFTDKLQEKLDDMENTYESGFTPYVNDYSEGSDGYGYPTLGALIKFSVNSDGKISAIKRVYPMEQAWGDGYGDLYTYTTWSSTGRVKIDDQFYADGSLDWFNYHETEDVFNLTDDTIIFNVTRDYDNVARVSYYPVYDKVELLKKSAVVGGDEFDAMGVAVANASGTTAKIVYIVDFDGQAADNYGVVTDYAMYSDGWTINFVDGSTVTGAEDTTAEDEITKLVPAFMVYRLNSDGMVDFLSSTLAGAVDGYELNKGAMIPAVLPGSKTAEGGFNEDFFNGGGYFVPLYWMGDKDNEWTIYESDVLDGGIVDAHIADITYSDSKITFYSNDEKVTVYIEAAPTVYDLTNSGKSFTLNSLNKLNDKVEGTDAYKKLVVIADESHEALFVFLVHAGFTGNTAVWESLN